jgi:hypothetical protein
MTKRLVFVVKQPSPSQVMEQAKQAIAHGKLSGAEAQAAERALNAGKTVPYSVMHKIKEGSK